MNQLLVKIKNRKKECYETFRKIIDNENCYFFPENLQCVEYNPNTLLEDGEWYVINNFSEKEYCIDLLKESSLNSVDFAILDKNEFSIIDYICSYQDDNIFYFQKIRQSQLLLKKRILFSFGKDYAYDSNNASIVINSYPDAIYKKDEDVLFFQKLDTISTIFKGISILYKEATNEEIKVFLKNDFIKVSEKFDVLKISKATRKKIAIAMDKLDGLSSDEKQMMLKYVEDTTELKYENNSFIIDNEKDIKNLVWGIMERIYITPIGKEKIVVNSIINIPNGDTETSKV